MPVGARPAAQVAAEPGVERAARDSLRPSSRLPERLGRGHRRQVLAGVGQGRADRLVGRGGEFSPTSLAAFAPVGVEDGLALEAQVACP